MNGTQLRNLRKANGMSIMELGKSLHVSKQMISKWENGLSPISEKRRLEILDIMKNPDKSKLYRITVNYEEWQMIKKMRGE